MILGAALLGAVLGALAAGPAVAHHVGVYVPRDNPVSANFKEIKFAIQARKLDVALQLFERGGLRAEMRARAATLPPGLEAATAAALGAGDAREAERHLMIFFSALARDLAREAERQLADPRTPAGSRLGAGQRFLDAIWRYYNLIDFAVSMRDSKTSVAIRLAFDEAESSARGPAAPAAVAPGAGSPPAAPARAADLDRLRASLGRIAQLLSNLIDASSTPARRDS